MLIAELVQTGGASSTVDNGQKRRVKWKGLRDNGKYHCSRAQGIPSLTKFSWHIHLKPYPFI